MQDTSLQIILRMDDVVLTDLAVAIIHNSSANGSKTP